MENAEQGRNVHSCLKKKNDPVVSELIISIDNGKIQEKNSSVLSKHYCYAEKELFLRSNEYPTKKLIFSEILIVTQLLGDLQRTSVEVMRLRVCNWQTG